ncbi:MAG: hypothetical protein FWC13_02295, partial [Oscillospiraceae bacterium]|nr:hypothetical protein [Oscillospiraceae bacterium]
MLDFVMNQGHSRGIHADIERSMNAQIGNMQVTASCLRVMAEAQRRMAADQDIIAGNARRTETRTRTNGTTYTVRVPDEAARARARTAAQAHRVFALALLRKADSIGIGAISLQEAMVRVRSIFNAIVDETIRTDRHHAARLNEISGWMENFTRRMSEIRNSIPQGGFPVDRRSMPDLMRQSNHVMDLITRRANAGMPSFSAFDCDPVNMSTGNFIYSKEDILVGGRYPL